MKLLLFSVAVLLLLGVCGCSFAHPPSIPHHHWAHSPFGFILYTDSGKEAATFVMNSGEPAQACIFELDNGPCQYFEHDQDALAWISDQFKSKVEQ